MLGVRGRARAGVGGEHGAMLACRSVHAAAAAGQCACVPMCTSSSQLAMLCSAVAALAADLPCHQRTHAGPPQHAPTALLDPAVAVHCGSQYLLYVRTAAAGLVYMGCWPMFNDSPASRWLAAGIIAVTTAYFILVGCVGRARQSWAVVPLPACNITPDPKPAHALIRLGVVKDKLLTAGATRTGKASELLAGPAMYGVVHIGAWG